MLAKKVCQKFLVESLKFLNGHSVRALTLMVLSLLQEGCQLTMTSLGRHLEGKSKVKTKIKRADDFLNNGIIYGNLPSIYTSIGQTLLKYHSTVVIGVDWSDSCSEQYCMLTASLLYQGRSIPLYQEVHAASMEENADVHINFLRRLKALIPDKVSVVIVTDAGFKTPWFLEVKMLGWDFIGRVRGNIQCYLESQSTWLFVKALHKDAEFKPKSLGSGWLSKTSATKMKGNFYIYREKSKGRKKPKQKCKSLFPDTEKRYSKMNSEPWVLFTSLNDEKLVSKNMIYIYKKRMQIEQNFRDSKNQRWGFGLRNSRTKTVARISMLCLLANLATVILWLIGFTAERKNYHYSFQANTIKTHRVLSFLVLAKQLLFHQCYKLNIRDIEESIRVMAKNYVTVVIHA